MCSQKEKNMEILNLVSSLVDCESFTTTNLRLISLTKNWIVIVLEKIVIVLE